MAKVFLSFTEVVLIKNKKKERRKMTMKEISELTGIPYQTLLKWSKAKGYRRNLVKFLRESDRSKIIEYFQEKGR